MKKIISLLIGIMVCLSFIGCTDKQSNLNKSEMKILNSEYTSLTQEQKDDIPVISSHMNLYDWDKYGPKLEKIYADRSINELAKVGSANEEADKKIGESEYKDTKAKAIKRLKGQPIADDEKEPSPSNETSNDSSEVATTVDSSNENSQADLTDSAIKFVTDSLKQDDLVEDAAIKESNTNSEITIAIQVNPAINNKKAKQLIESAARQLGFACGGKAPEKYYLGEIWEKYDGTIIIFSGNDNIMLKGYVTKGAVVIRYSDGTSLKLIN